MNQSTSNDTSSKLSTTSIHISKNWVLPERLKPGRKPVLRTGSDISNRNTSTTRSTGAQGSVVMRHQLARSLLGADPEPTVTIASITNVNDMKDDSNDGKVNNGDSAARRRKQNRDAQRAYRERKANRIHVLEDTVNDLKKDVEMWKLKFDTLFKEQQFTQDELKQTLEENINLSNQINFLQNELNQNSTITKDSISIIPSNKIENNSLNEMIQNFTPMKAIPLLKRTSKEKKCSGDGTSSCCKGKLKKQQDSIQIEKKNELPDMSVWTPGSCDNCKRDPTNKAFCQSIFKNNTNPLSNLPQFVKKSDTTTASSSSQKQLPASPVSLSNESNNNIITPNPSSSSGCCGNCPKKTKKEYIPITDTYQRIRKHMTSQTNNNLCISKLQNESNKEKNSTLINVLQKIATNIEVNGREIEINSIEHALNNLQQQ
ncbi:hypothetical protein C6P45_004505 [Maudiozyma exigua]|uniref:BZIP domain-containing protein n=1 Tax=Maudiozyma exigua TaxID=34358 RepID=A0A9P6WBS3_MAUEX|nr:hypothetical protein C6P45_004505 [Kazachstania exigua]